MKLFLDTNVILDVLADREPWAEDSATVVSLLESEHIEGVVAAHTITTLHYLLEKYLGSRKARAAVVDLLRLVSVAAVTGETLLKALSLGWADFEDAVQAVCAIDAEVDYMITRNVGDYRGVSVPVLTPSDFLAVMRSAAEKPTRKPRRKRS